MTEKRMTRERADRSHKRFKYFVYGYRAFLLIYTAGLLGTVLIDAWQWHYLAYLLLNGMWWVLSILWLKNNDDNRDLNYRTADRWREIDRLYGEWR